jgi:deferrochelatase/peroxidase EfeB
VPQPGLDTIIGQGDNNELVITGANPHKLDEKLDVRRWVKPRGGEYFFSPSISALRDAFAQAA